MVWSLTSYCGGMIAPDKSKWFLIDSKWTGSDYVYRSLEETPGEIILLDRNGIRITLERLDVSMAAESLGVWIAMDGNHEREIPSVCSPNQHQESLEERCFVHVQLLVYEDVGVSYGCYTTYGTTVE